MMVLNGENGSWAESTNPCTDPVKVPKGLLKARPDGGQYTGIQGQMDY